MTSKVRIIKMLSGVVALLLLYFWAEPCGNKAPCFYVHSCVASVITCYTAYNTMLLYNAKQNSNVILSVAEVFMITVCIKVVREVGLCDSASAQCNHRLLPLVVAYTTIVLIATTVEAVYLICKDNEKEAK